MSRLSSRRGRFSRRQFCRSSAIVAGALMMSGCGSSWSTPAHADNAIENVQVSHDSFAQHTETCIAANPLQPQNLMGITIVGASIATYASFDSGASWQSNGVLPLPDGALRAGDPTVAFDGAGCGFACGEVLGLHEICVWRTTDGGKSFAAPVLAMQGQTVDHPWLAADRSAGPSSGNLYVVWATNNLTQLGFTRSTDGGRSFESPRTITNAEEITVVGTMAATGAHGLVAAIYGAASASSGGDDPDADAGKGGRRPESMAAIRVVCSTDYGQTFSKPVELGTGSTELVFPDGQAGSPSLPTIAVDQHHNTLYAVFVTHQSQAASSDIMLSASYDSGRTWSAAQSITPGNNALIYFQPQLAVDEAGRVAVSAYAFDSTQNLANVVLFVSEPHALRFGQPLTVTSQPFSPAQGAPNGGLHGTWWIGDFQGLTSTPGAFHPFWDDTRTGELEVFTATVHPGQW